MSVFIETVDELQDYLRAVLANARHHAGNVDGAVLALVGSILLRKDKGVPIEVRTNNGKMTNQSWVTKRNSLFSFV